MINLLKKTVISLHKQENGQGMVEYALIIMFVALVAFITLEIFGTSLRDLYLDIANGF